MHFNTYTAEKLMQQRLAVIQKESRNAWMWKEIGGEQSSLRLPKLFANILSKKEMVSNAVSDACCGCCALNA